MGLIKQKWPFPRWSLPVLVDFGGGESYVTEKLSRCRHRIWYRTPTPNISHYDS